MEWIQNGLTTYTFRKVPFLTLEDPNAKIKGSRDPLGVQPIWTAFGRYVVTNLTTQSTSIRGFTILLLGRYFAADLLDRGMSTKEDALDIFLRMEQVGAYVRHVAHGVQGEIRGIERVKQFVDERHGNVVIAADRRGMILSDQKVYGLWGLYSVPARTSGLIPDGAFDVIPAAREFIERHYISRLNGSAGKLRKLLSEGGDFVPTTEIPSLPHSLRSSILDSVPTSWSSRLISSGWPQRARCRRGSSRTF